MAKSTSVSRPHWTENPTWQCLSFVGQCLKQEKNMGTCRTLQVMGTMCLTEFLPKVENTTVTISEIPKDCMKEEMHGHCGKEYQGRLFFLEGIRIAKERNLWYWGERENGNEK